MLILISDNHLTLEFDMHRHLPSLFHEFNEWRNLLSSIDDFHDEKPHSSTGVSLYEDKDHLYVELAVPGLVSDEIQISFEKGVLWVKGESKKTEDKEKKEIKYHFTSSQSFSYRVPLPAKVDEAQTPNAKLKNGVLKVIFEKARATRPQHIQIKEES
jgi:HSP20 family protein